MEGANPRSWGSPAMALMWHNKNKSCGHDNDKTISVANSESRDDDSSSVNVLGGLAKNCNMFSICTL